MEVAMQKEINLKLLLAVFKKHIFLLLVITGITTMLSGAYSHFAVAPPPIYQSSTSILLNLDNSDSLNSLEVVLREPTVLSTVIEELGLNMTPDELNREITFGNDGGSKIVKIIATDVNPELAASIANTTANIFIKQIGNILGIYDVRIITEAQVSNFPFSIPESPSLLKYLILGIGVGLIGSIGIILFLDSLDETIQSEREIESLLGLPVIGSVSKMDRKNTKKHPVQRTSRRRRGVKYGA